jgi:serine/threonine protein kinase
MCILGKPRDSYITKFNLPQAFYNYFEEMDDIIPYDLAKLLNKYNWYNESDVIQAADLLGKLICWDFDERLSAEDALKHSFFN